MWFLNCRAEPVGGDVCPVKITDGTLTYLNAEQALTDIRGRHVLLGIHGFNVNQSTAVDHFETWNRLLQLDSSAIFLGGLWPGDSSWLGALEYAFAAKAAMRAGAAFAGFLNTLCGAALSVSFVSHSLGARVALATIQALSSGWTVRRLVLMAPAVDDNCLTNEFAAAARRVGDISVLASPCDEVLKLAFPLGNAISGIFAQSHPYWHAALGREGPAAYPMPNNIHAGWSLPGSWRIDHSDYLPPSMPYPPHYDPAPYSVPIDVPLPTSAAPAAGTPAVFDIDGQWEYWPSAWTAALTSSRFR